MWLFFILMGIIALVLFSFTRARKTQQIKVIQQGGMIVKYRDLISFLMADPSAKITLVNAEHVIINLHGEHEVFRFIVAQTFGKVTVIWKLQDYRVGNHKLEWTFPEYDDQRRMSIVILHEVTSYMEVRGWI